MPPRKAPVALSERLLKLQLETGVSHSYQITDDLVVEPPTKARGAQMHEASMRLGILNSLLSQAISQDIPRPAHPGFSCTPEQLAAYDKALTDWEAEIARHTESTNDIASRIQAAEDDYNKAFFGAAHDRVMRFFENQPQRLWDAFVADIKAEFLPKAPDNGVCLTCGHTDEDTAGKAPESST